MSYLVRIDANGESRVIDWSTDPSEFTERVNDLNFYAVEGVEYVVEVRE